MDKITREAIDAVPTEQKTIFMPKEILARWLEGLRSGEYKQGFGRLFDGTGYCCLGVLQMVVDGRVQTWGDTSVRTEYGINKPGNLPLGTPTLEWLRSHKIRFFNAGGGDTNPYLPALHMGATTANDASRKSFAQIADAIEAAAIGE